MRPNRCKECGKVIRSCNKSGLCSHHNRVKSYKERRKKTCWVCKEECSGQMQIETRKGTIKPFCTIHFNKLNQPKFADPAKLRAEIKYLQSYH